MTIADRQPPHSPAARDAIRRIHSGAAAVLLCACGLAQAQQQSDALPPAGMITGAYGQSLQAQPQQQASLVPIQVGAVAAAQAKPGPVAPADAVSRFLKERGILAQAQGESSGLLDHVRDSASDLVLSAMNFLGVRYTRGGNTASTGFDCSGFTRHIFEMSIGLVLPRRADEQAKMNSLLNIKRDELKPGDLVFFNTMRATFSHVGIYVGEGKFVHAPRTGAAVRVDDMREAYWAKRFTGARRAAEVRSSSALPADTALR